MTPLQARLYQFLVERKDDLVCPSYSEMMEACGVSSRGGIARIVNDLVGMGLVSKAKGKKRRTRVVELAPPITLEGSSLEQLALEAMRRGYLLAPMLDWRETMVEVVA